MLNNFKTMLFILMFGSSIVQSMETGIPLENSTDVSEPKTLQDQELLKIAHWRANCQLRREGFSSEIDYKECFPDSHYESTISKNSVLEEQIRVLSRILYNANGNCDAAYLRLKWFEKCSYPSLKPELYELSSLLEPKLQGKTALLNILACCDEVCKAMKHVMASSDIAAYTTTLILAGVVTLSQINTWGIENHNGDKNKMDTLINVQTQFNERNIVPTVLECNALFSNAVEQDDMVLVGQQLEKGISIDVIKKQLTNAIAQRKPNVLNGIAKFDASLLHRVMIDLWGSCAALQPGINRVSMAQFAAVYDMLPPSVEEQKTVLKTRGQLLCDMVLPKEAYNLLTMWDVARIQNAPEDVFRVLMSRIETVVTNRADYLFLIREFIKLKNYTYAQQLVEKKRLGLREIEIVWKKTRKQKNEGVPEEFFVALQNAAIDRMPNSSSNDQIYLIRHL